MEAGQEEFIYQSWLSSPGRDHTGHAVSFIGVLSLPKKQQSCSLAIAVVMSPVYKTATWQWIYFRIFTYHLSMVYIQRIYMKSIQSFMR
jgi:hypothetical protein